MLSFILISNISQQAQIYGVYEEVEKLRKETTEKEKYLARLQHTNNTDHMAEVQVWKGLYKTRSGKKGLNTCIYV